MIKSVKRQDSRFYYPGDEIVVKRDYRPKLDGITKQAMDTGRTRLWVTASVFALAFSAIGFRIVDLMVFEAGPTVTNAARTIVHAPITERADLVDRNGIVIATNLPTVNLYADPRQVLDPAASAKALAQVLPERDEGELLDRLAAPNRQFVYLSRNLTPKQQSEIIALGLPGVEFEQAEQRVYPQGRLFAHIAGATNLDNEGIAGLERGLNKQLQTSIDPVKVTLDVRVQHAVRSVLSEAVEKFKAKSGVGLVMDPNTGDVLALVSLPDFEPEQLGSAPDSAKFNNATLGLFEMGSTFKLFTVAMGIDSGLVGLTDGYDATKALTVSGFTIHDFHAQKRWLTIPEILIYSSNIAAGKLALDIGTATQQAYLTKLGLLTPADVVLPEVAAPIFPSVWRDINTVTISYGHGISVSPLQVTSATAAVVNGGYAIRPRFVFDDANPWRDQPEQVFSEVSSKTMRALMRLVVLEGSGKQADVKGYSVGGKTGSAEKIDPATGTYSDNLVRTSFVAAFPIMEPRYVVLVMLDEPQGLKETYNFATAGWNAAPTVGRIIERIAPILGVYPTDGHITSDPAIREMIPVAAAGLRETAANATR